MSKQCKIVEDLLPLYHDGVCSEESRQMVDEHLAQCEDCRKMLGQIDGELVSPAAKDADIKPLKNINKAVNRGKRKALVAGIAITLAVLLAVFIGWGTWWYTHEYAYYAAFAEGHPPMSVYEIGEDGSVLQSIVVDEQRYIWEDDTYSYTVIVPGFLSDNGYINMQRKDSGEEHGQDVGIGRWNGTEYVFHVSIRHEGEGNYHYFIVDRELNIHNMPHSTSAYNDQLRIDLDEHREEVQKLIDDAMAMWPFIK